MSKEFRCGLVVGKFSPLHRGHELVINRAFELCREVAIISYSNPEFSGCEAERRERWLGELFPQADRLVVTTKQLSANWPGCIIPPNDAEDLTHRRFVGFLCREILRVTVDAVFTSEDYGAGLAQELTTYFRQSDPTAPAVSHVLVDRDRRRVPISGAMLRRDIEVHRRWLSPIVYASFVRRVCLLGGESSGKSTLAEALAAHFETAHVPEYGRELWEQRKGALTYEDLLQIGEQQVTAEEKALLGANRFLFCDTSPLTTLFYSHYLFGRADPNLEQLAKRQYDSVILCGIDFPFVQDGTRQEATFRERQHAWYMTELTRRKIPFLLATGEVEERIAKISEHLQKGSNTSW